MYFGPNGERLQPPEGTYYHDDEADGFEYTGVGEGVEIPVSEALKVQFDRLKLYDISAEEARRITALIRRILSHNASERPRAEEIIQDDWFRTAD